MKFRLWTLCFAALMSCQSQISNTKQILRINIQDEPQSLDPRKARDLNAVTMIHMLFEGLVRIGQNGAAELALAQSVDVSEDGRKYTFRLRDAVWTNHEPVTSYDFAQSWRKVLDPAFPSDLAYQLYVIKGAKSAKTGETSLDQVAIRTPDPKTLIVELDQPTPYFLELLTFPAFFPVFHRLDVENPHWAENPEGYVSNGPFVLRRWKHANMICVAKNSSYWDAGSVRLQRIDLLMIHPETELRMFLDTGLDWAGSPLSSLPADALQKLKENRTLQVQPLLGTAFLRVNTLDRSLLSQPAFRKALSLAIDREKITEHVLQGGQLPAKALVPPLMGLSANGYFADADPKAFLAEALKKNGRTAADLPAITLLFVAGERNQIVAQAVQQQIQAALGISIQLEAVERKMFYERIAKKQYQLAAGSWIADFNDPINFLEVFKYANGSTNNTGWEHPKYIERLNLSAVCQDPEERKKLFQEAEQLLMEEMPLIPIYHFSLNYLEREGVKDVCLSPIGQIDFRWCHIEKK